MIIADTGFFVALGSRSDRFHQKAINTLNSLRENLITTYPVITETSYLLMQRSHLTKMLELMIRYSNLPMDLADASLVVLAEEINEGRILSTDRRDFSVYRWHNTQPFQNLLD